MQKYDNDDALRPLGLRPATADDTSFLMSLFASTRSDELALLASDQNLRESFIAMQFEAQRRSFPPADHQIILWQERPIGRTLINRSDEAFHLVDISLLPEARNAGIGSHLISELLQEAKEAGKPVTLHVVISNPAKRLYERLGFKEIEDNSSFGTKAYVEMIWTPPPSK